MGVPLGNSDRHAIAGLSFEVLRTISVFIVSYVLCKIVLQRTLSYREKCASFPPGPTGWPLLGYTPYLGKYPYKVMAQLAKQYGDVFSMSIGPQTVVVVNGVRAVRDAMIQQGRQTAGRTPTGKAVAIDTTKGIFWSSGDLWFTQRKFAQACLRQFAMSNYGLSIEHEAKAMCEEIARKSAGGTPIAMAPIFDTATANILSSIVFAHRFEYDGDEFRKIKECSTHLQRGGFASLENYFIFLYKLPFFFRETKEKKRYIQNFVLEKLHQNRNLATNPAHARNVAQLFDIEMKSQSQGDTSKRVQFTENSVATAVWDVFIAGVETTSHTLAWAALYLVLQTDIQKKVQDEIDSLIRLGKNPSWAEREHMPYTRATIMEIQRLSNVVPIAVPHTVTEDIKFYGNTLPKGTVMFINLWSVMTDPEQWEKPQEFNPERFLDENNRPIKPETYMPFGLGPRVCLGEQLAKQELLELLTALLKQFDLSLPEGDPRPPLDGIPGMSNGPCPFKVCVTPRKQVGGAEEE